VKGTAYNGSHFTRKGTSRAEGISMFSVNNVVAFSYKSFCSPDGRSYSRGICPTTTDYLLQEDIVLEEYDNTVSNRYGSGNYDTKKIVELSDVFWHEYSTQNARNIFLLQVLDSNKNIFADAFIEGDIAEVRNHRGKFLHIYKIPERYFINRVISFEETVKAINLKKKQEDSFEEEKELNRYRSIDLIFGITSSGWYASSASFGDHSVELQHEHDNTKRSHYTLRIADCVPKGRYEFYLLNGTPISLHVSDGEPIIDTMTDTHWANSQSWKYSKITELTFNEGWFTVDGVDVYLPTKEKIEEESASIKSARMSRFEDLSVPVREKYGEEVLKIVTKKKGSVLAMLDVLSKNPFAISNNEMKKAINFSDTADLLENLLAIIAAEVEPTKAAKVAEKGYAWAYLHNALPEIEFTGRFDDAHTALQIYSEEWREKTYLGRLLDSLDVK